MLEIRGDGLARVLPDGGEAGFAAFAGHADPAFFEAEVFQACIEQFGEAQAAGVEKLQDGPVAAIKGAGTLDGFDEFFHVRLAQGAGEAFFESRRQKRVCGIFADVTARGQKTEKDLQSDQFEPCGARGEAVFFPLGQIIADDLRGDRGGGLQLLFFPAPGREGLQHATHEQLVVHGEAALRGDVEDKGVDELRHGGQHARARAG